MSDIPKEILKLAEAAELLQVSERWLRRHLASIPHVRIGAQIRFSRTALIELVSAVAEARKPGSLIRVDHPKADF